MGQDSMLHTACCVLRPEDRMLLAAVEEPAKLSVLCCTVLPAYYVLLHTAWQRQRDMLRLQIPVYMRLLLHNLKLLYHDTSIAACA